MMLSSYLYLLHSGSWDLDLHIRMLLVLNILITWNLTSTDSDRLNICFQFLNLYGTVEILCCLVHIITLLTVYDSNILVRAPPC